MHLVPAFASSSIVCTAGARDPRPGREVQNCQEMRADDREGAWVPIMAHCTPHGETPAQVWVAQPLTSGIQDPRGRGSVLRGSPESIEDRS